MAKQRRIVTTPASAMNDVATILCYVVIALFGEGGSVVKYDSKVGKLLSLLGYLVVWSAGIWQFGRSGRVLWLLPSAESSLLS